MKLLIILGLSFIYTGIVWSSTGYEIHITEEGYNLTIEFDFSAYQSVESVRKALINPGVITELSPHVVSVTNTGPLDNYQSLMLVKSFGIKSKLLSKCQESFEENKWSRSCILQTDVLDGGKYMISKTDQVICTQLERKNVKCLFSIKGKTKPLTILGIELLDARAFAAKAKAQALINFFKIYYFANNYNTSIKKALDQFDSSIIKTELEDFEHDATRKRKKGLGYHRYFKLPELQ